MARSPIATPNTFTQSPAVLAPDGESILFGTMEGGFTLRCVRIADGTTLFEYLVGPLGAPMFLAMTLDGTRVLCGLSTGVALVLPYAALAELGRTA